MLCVGTTTAVAPLTAPSLLNAIFGWQVRNAFGLFFGVFDQQRMFAVDKARRLAALAPAPTPLENVGCRMRVLGCPTAALNAHVAFVSLSNGIGMQLIPMMLVTPDMIFHNARLTHQLEWGLVVAGHCCLHVL